MTPWSENGRAPMLQQLAFHWELSELSNLRVWPKQQASSLALMIDSEDLIRAGVDHPE